MMRFTLSEGALLLLVLFSGCTFPSSDFEEKIPLDSPEQAVAPLAMEEQQDSVTRPSPTNSTVQPTWTSGSMAIAGKYADADIVNLGNGKYRMYYSAEPEVPGFKGQVYSSVSSDGKNWVQESGTRKERAIFPSVLKLPDGRYRMYFQNQGVIKSALSSDGLSWQDEPGTRLDTANTLGLNFINVLAPTVLHLDGKYLMVYAGAIDERYAAEKVPNSETHVLLWATSADGLNFEKKGLAVESRNAEFKGWLDGPELVSGDGGEIRLYFWSYRGIYHVTYRDGQFSSDAIFDYTTGENPLAPFPENPPGDPTLAKINGTWLLYYGQHTEGIYYAVWE